MKTSSKKVFLILLALVVMLSTLTGVVSVHASEEVISKRYAITNEIANYFKYISEIASKSYDIKDIKLKKFYIKLSKK